MRGLINSREFLELPDGVRLTIEDVREWRPPDVSLVATAGDRELWRTVLPGFEPDITSTEVDINTVDYRVAHWAGLVVLAGELGAYVVDRGDGRIRRELELGATGLSTVDFIGFVDLKDVLAVASAKVVWLLDESANVVGEFRYDGPIDSISAGGEGELVISFYDVHVPAFPLVDHIVEVSRGG